MSAFAVTEDNVYLALSEKQDRQGVARTPTGVYIDVHELGAHSNNEVYRSGFFVVNGGVASSSRSGSTAAGSLLAVNDQGGADCDNEMRRKYVVCRKEERALKHNYFKAPAYQLKTISLFEFIDTSTGINQLLLAREERMAIAASIYFENFALFRRAGFESSSTSASNGYFVIFRMDISFHYIHLAVRFFLYA